MAKVKSMHFHQWTVEPRTAYGEADLMLIVSDRIKITAFGEAKVHYKGNGEIVKGYNFGDVSLVKPD